MDQIINHAVLSLDFWQDTVTYEGCTMPTGTIGCEVLNIPDSTIEKLDAPCNVLNQLLQGMNTGSVDMELLPQVQQAAGEIISFLQVTPPFSRLNRSYFEQKLAAIFSEEYMEDAKAYLQLSHQEQLICALTGQHSKASNKHITEYSNEMVCFFSSTGAKSTDNQTNHRQNQQHR